MVADYLKQAGLQDDLDRLGYELVGFGCATCIGNSGPLLPEISEAINANDLTVTAVLSGNRNFEGRISPDVKMNYLASPPLVIAYALAGTMDFDFEHEALGKDPEGNDVYLKDIWPTNAEVEQVVSGNVSREMFLNDYASVFEGDSRWKGLDVPEGELFAQPGVHVRTQADLLRRHERHAGSGRGHSRRTRARAAGRFGHDGPHLSGGCVQGLEPGGQVSRRTWRRAEELQLIRIASWQP